MKVVCSTICDLAFALLLSAQPELHRNVIQLAQLKRDVGASLATLNNYTCIETIDRSDRKKPQEPFRHRDTLHLEVAVAH